MAAPLARSLVGRAAELARLRSAFVTASGGDARVVVLGGEAGIGKTRLVDALTSDVGGMARIVTGACLATADGALPYAPFVEILRELVQATPPGRLVALLGPGRAELRQLLPELATRAADLGPDPVADGLSRVRLFEIILGLFQRLAQEGPLVVVVEDIQWADRATRELLSFLVRTLRDQRILIVLTTRTETTGAEPAGLAILDFVAELEREEHVERIELGRLDREELGEQVAALLGETPSPATLDRLQSRTDGNPFFVEELIQAGGLTEPGLPVVLRDVLASRIGHLSSGAREVLRAAAAAGRRIDDGLLSTALRIPPSRVRAALREAEDAGILMAAEAADGPATVFRHALLQEAAERELYPSERTALHAAFAEALEARLAGGDRRVAAAEIARHWDGAYRPDRALVPTIRAAQESELVCAFSEAAHLWERAHELMAAAGRTSTVDGIDAAGTLGSAADCALLAGEHRRAIDLGRAAIDAIDTARDPERAATLQNRLRWYLWESGDRDGTAAAVRQALDRLPARPASRNRAQALAQSAGIHLFAGDLERAATLAREAIRMARAVDAPSEAALALGILGWSLAAGGDVEAGLATYRDGQRVAAEVGRPEGMALAATNLAGLLDRVGRPSEALAEARDGYALTERLGLTRTYGATLLGYEAKAELALGRWDDADATTALGLRRGASDPGTLWLLVQRARLQTRRGRYPEADLLLDRASSIDGHLGETDFRMPMLVARAELAAAQGRVETVRQIGERGLAGLRPGGPPDPTLAWLAVLVIRAEADAVEQARGRRPAEGPSDPAAHAAWLARMNEAVDAAIARLGRAAHRAGGREAALLALLHAEGSRLGGRPDPGGWYAVSQAWSAVERPYETAYAWYRGAEATLASRGPREQAADWLRRSHAAATKLGAAPLQAASERLARHARIGLDHDESEVANPSPPGDGATGPLTGADLGFTPRELEVLDLLAAGRTNQQIADALFITRKTASVHVSNILAKLGVSRRAEAVALAHRLGLAVEDRAASVG